MFKQSRRKIVAAIMSVLILLWAGTLGIIYACSYIEMREQNRRLLTAHAEMYVLPQGQPEIPPEKPRPDGRPAFVETPMFQLSTFYTVAMGADGQVLEIKNERKNVHTDEKLLSLAKEIIAHGKVTGTEDNLVFYRANKGRYTLVAFMDNTIINENAEMLLRYTLIFGSVAMVVFFFLAVFLARKIVAPLEQSHQKQKQFISDAGHELKTPVSVVSANAELLSRELGDNQWLANIRYENERMGLLVGQLLELARTEAVAPMMEQLDLSRLVSGEALPFESVAFEKGLELSYEIAEGISMEGNGAQLRQLVSILLDNAISHSKGKVFLLLAKEQGGIRLSVINEGEEIPKEQRERLFERFYRADAARSDQEGHYGLGLAIAKAIVSAHKGKIDIVCYDSLVEFKVIFQ